MVMDIFGVSDQFKVKFSTGNVSFDEFVATVALDSWLSSDTDGILPDVEIVERVGLPRTTIKHPWRAKRPVRDHR
jgi:hypothetical protein